VEVEPAVSQEPAVHQRGLVGTQVVQDHMHVEPVGTLRFTLFKNATKSALVWVERMSVITVPVAMFKAAKRSQVPLRS